MAAQIRTFGGHVAEVSHLVARRGRGGPRRERSAVDLPLEIDHRVARHGEARVADAHLRREIEGEIEETNHAQARPRGGEIEGEIEGEGEETRRGR